MYALALDSVRNPSLPPSPRVPAEYGLLLTEAQRELGLKDRELARRAGFKGGPKDNTMGRLRRGEGSFKMALAVREVLVKLGKNIPPVPIPGAVARQEALESPQERQEQPEQWLEEWISLGRRLHEHASTAQFAKQLQALRELVAAYERIAQHMAAISHPLPRDVD